MSSSTRIDELWKKFEENPRRFFAPLANEHRKAGDLEQAIAICRQHLPDQPGHISGHIVLAQALLEKGELPEASDAFQAALALDPENLIALRCMGDIARTVGDLETARLWYERVLDVDPRNDEINALIREIDAAPASAPEPEPEPVWSPEETDGAVSEPLAFVADAPIEANETLPDEALMDAADFATGPAAGAEASVSADAEPDVPALIDFEPTSREDAIDDGRSDAEPSLATPMFDMDADTADFSIDMVPAQEIGNSPEAPAAPLYEAAEPVANEVAPEFEAWGFDEPETLVESPDLSTGASELSLDAGPESTADYGEFSADGSSEEPAAVTRSLDALSDGDTLSLDAPSDGDALSLDAPNDESAEAAAELDAEWPSLDAEAVVAESAADADASVPVIWPEVAAQGSADESEFAGADRGDSWFEPEEAAMEAESIEPVAGIESAEFSGDAAASAGAAIEGFMLEEPPGYHLTPADGSTSIVGGEPVADEEEPIIADASPAATEVDAVAPARPTPATGVEHIAPVTSGFVTETMAELYLQQGYRDEALAVYRELLSQHPGDAALRERVTHLEAGEASSVSIESLSTPASPGPSARAFFAGVARHAAPARSHAPPPLQPRRATPTVLTSLPASALDTSASDASASDAAARGSLDALFGRTPVDDGSERAAETLASAFESEPPAGGEPTRAAASELSLDSVFGGTPPSVPATNGGSDFSFDQFFASPDQEDPGDGIPTRSAVPERERPNDIEQFTAWLEGLKRK